MILLRLVLVALLACSAIAGVAEIGDEAASAPERPAASPPLARSRGPPPMSGPGCRTARHAHAGRLSHPLTIPFHSSTIRIPDLTIRERLPSGIPTAINPQRTTIE